MAKNVKRTILSEKSPRNRHIAWAEPKGESIQLNIFNNGKWRPIAGSGNSSSDSSGCGCYDVVIKGINKGDGFNYTVEKGNFEEVYNGILSGKMYSFKIVEFTPSSEDEGHGYNIFHYYPNDVLADSTVSKIKMKRTITSYYVWTPEEISVEDTGGK